MIDPDSREYALLMLKCLNEALPRYRKQRNRKWIYITEMKIAFYEDKIHGTYEVDGYFEERRKVKKERDELLDEYILQHPKTSSTKLGEMFEMSQSYCAKRKTRLLGKQKNNDDEIRDAG